MANIHILPLISGEKIDFRAEAKKAVNTDDNHINDKYVKGEVRIVTEQARYPLDNISTMIDSKKYRLAPDYQRRRRWNNDKKSKLIESFIMNVPIPPIFLYENELSYYEVMDGQQRLSTIDDFYKNEIELSGLELWPELNGRKYENLPEKIRQGIDRRYLSSIILLQESAKSEYEAQYMKQLVFERINSGGVALTAQETRNALYNGPMNQLCLLLSKDQHLRKLIGLPIDFESEQLILSDTPDGDIESDEDADKLLEHETYRRMDDVEYVLRFFAMRQIEGYTNLKLHEFLDVFLQRANHYSEETLSSLSQLYKDTIEFADELFDKEAFYLWRRRNVGGNMHWYWFSRATTTVFDPLMYVLSALLPYKEQLIAQKAQIKEKLKPFYKDNYPQFEGRSSNKNLTIVLEQKKAVRFIVQ